MNTTQLASKHCGRCKGWGFIETSRRVVGEPGARVARKCRTCDGSGRRP